MAPNVCTNFFQVCLYNITADPCELNNLVFNFPDVVRLMERTVELFRETAVPPANKPIDPRGDPKLYNYTWTNWMDYYDEFVASIVDKDKKFRPNFNNAAFMASIRDHVNQIHKI